MPIPVLAWWTTGAIAAPGVAAALWVVLVLLAQGVAPSLVDGRTMTLPEAAALGSKADIVLHLRAGADGNAPGRVRRGVLREIDQRMTPLEASVAGLAGDRRGVLRLIVDSGAVLDGSNYPVLWCLADYRRNRDALLFLQESFPGTSPPDCASIRTPW